jgi:hypothetical protein
MAHLTGNDQERDDSIESAAELLAQLPKLRCSQSRSTIS